MKKKITVLSALVAALMVVCSLAGCGGGGGNAQQAKAEEEWKTLSVANATISYPATWVVVDAEENNILGDSVTEAKGVSPSADSDTAVALADMTQANVGLDTMKTGLSAMGYEITSLTLGGCDAIGFSMPVGDVSAQAYVIDAGGPLLMLIGAINPNDDAKVKEQYQKIMDSFTVEAPTTLDDLADALNANSDGGDPNAAAQAAADQQNDEADSGE